MPDLNSLPPSNPSRSPNGSSPTMIRSMSIATSEYGSGSSGRRQSPSPSGNHSPLSRSASTSLQAAAAVNAGLQQEDSRRSSIISPTGSLRNRQSSNTGRRRSVALMNLQLNDPSLPPPGEMISENQQTSYRTSSPQSLGGSPIIGTGDPHHQRAPSLGEIHQELEQEQEAQVNRLLQMIRTQQQQLQAYQSSPQSTAPAVDDSSAPTTASDRSNSFSLPNPYVVPAPLRSPSLTNTRNIFDHDRQRQPIQPPSQSASPRMTSQAGNAGEADGFVLGSGGRDESAFYQAEAQMVTRENQMLRNRIRELERQITELQANAAITHEPAIHSSLSRSESVFETAPPEISRIRVANGDELPKVE